VQAIRRSIRDLAVKVGEDLLESTPLQGSVALLDRASSLTDPLCKLQDFPVRKVASARYKAMLRKTQHQLKQFVFLTRVVNHQAVLVEQNQHRNKRCPLIPVVKRVIVNDCMEQGRGCHLDSWVLRLAADACVLPEDRRCE